MTISIPVAVICGLGTLALALAYVGAATKALVLEDMNKTLSGILAAIFDHLKAGEATDEHP